MSERNLTEADIEEAGKIFLKNLAIKIRNFKLDENNKFIPEPDFLAAARLIPSFEKKYVSFYDLYVYTVSLIELYHNLTRELETKVLRLMLPVVESFTYYTACSNILKEFPTNLFPSINNLYNSSKLKIINFAADIKKDYSSSFMVSMKILKYCFVLEKSIKIIADRTDAPDMTLFLDPTAKILKLLDEIIDMLNQLPKDNRIKKIFIGNIPTAEVADSASEFQKKFNSYIESLKPQKKNITKAKRFIKSINSFDKQKLHIILNDGEEFRDE